VLAVLHGLVWLLIGVALLGLIASMVSLLRVVLSYDRSTRKFTARRLPVKTWVACGIAWILMFVSIEIFEALLRARVREVLATTSSALAVEAEGGQLRDPAPVVAAIRDIKRASAHHSSPARCAMVTLSAAPTILRLRLCQDSQDPTEYWVFYPEFRFSAMNEIGRVFIAVPPWQAHASQQESSNLPMHLAAAVPEMVMAEVFAAAGDRRRSVASAALGTSAMSAFATPSRRTHVD